MTKEEVMDWMMKQMEACDIQNTPLDSENRWFICNAGGNPDKRIHVYGIDNLYEIFNGFCEEIGITLPYYTVPHSLEHDEHYFVWKDYKFFGLVEKGVSK